MTSFDDMRAGFLDELEKIAGQAETHVRSGRRPISAQKLLEKDKEKDSEIIKLSAGKGSLAKPLGLMAAGAGGYHMARKAEMDRRLGRQMRLMNSQQPQ